MPPESLQHPESCPIKEDLRFQQITWIVERVGWIVMALIVVLACAGLFGGPTTWTETRDASGRVQVSYQRFQRELNATEMRLVLDTQGQSLLEVTIDKDLAAAFEIRSVVPQPIEMHAHEGGLLLRFAATADGGQPARVTLMVVPSQTGRIKGGIGLLGETPAPIDIFSYP